LPNEGFSWKREENKKVKEIKEDHRNLMKRNSAIIKRKIINANRKITTSGFLIFIFSQMKGIRLFLFLQLPDSKKIKFCPWKVSLCQSH